MHFPGANNRSGPARTPVPDAAGAVTVTRLRPTAGEARATGRPESRHPLAVGPRLTPEVRG